MWWADLGSGVAHTSYHGGGDCGFGFSCSRVRIWPLDGIVLCVPANGLVRLTVVTELFGVRVQAPARVNKWVSTVLSERMSAWQFR